MKRVMLKQLIEDRLYSICTFDDLIELSNNYIYSLILDTMDIFDADITECKNESNLMLSLIQDEFMDEDSKYTQIEKSLQSLTVKNNNTLENYKTAIENSEDIVFDYIFPLISISRNIPSHIDIETTNKRWLLEVKKLEHLYFSTLKIYSDYIEIQFDEFHLDLNFIADFIRERRLKPEKHETMKNSMIEEQDSLLINAVNENNYLKIFDYRGISQLAESMNFKLVRQKGDHAIFKHEITGETLPIPARTVGSGLSYKIQKQLREKSCVA